MRTQRTRHRISGKFTICSAQISQAQTDETLNRAAVEGLLAQLRGKALLVGSGVEEATTNTVLSKAVILESNVVYLRASCVTNVSRTN